MQLDKCNVRVVLKLTCFCYILTTYEQHNRDQLELFIYPKSSVASTKHRVDFLMAKSAVILKIGFQNMTSSEKRIHIGYYINSLIIFLAFVKMLTNLTGFFREKLQIDCQQNELYYSVCQV